LADRFILLPSNAGDFGEREKRPRSRRQYCLTAALSKRNARRAGIQGQHEVVDPISGNVGRRTIGPGKRGFMPAQCD
jgi:hypothetical protein